MPDTVATPRLVEVRRTIHAPRQRVFDAWTKAEEIKAWHAPGPMTVSRADIDLRPGGAYRIHMVAPTGEEHRVVGTYREVDPPRRLVHTMRALWGEDVKSEGYSRVTWEIEPVGDSCRLVLTHDQLREGANDQLYGGWPMILSGLKTWLETGQLLTTPGSMMYA